MDEDRKLRRQQVLVFVIGAVSFVGAIAVAIDIAVGGAGSWWTVVGSSFTGLGMVIVWFNLRSIRRKAQNR